MVVSLIKQFTEVTDVFTGKSEMDNASTKLEFNSTQP